MPCVSYWPALIARESPDVIGFNETKADVAALLDEMAAPGESLFTRRVLLILGRHFESGRALDLHVAERKG